MDDSTTLTNRSTIRFGTQTGKLDVLCVEVIGRGLGLAIL